MNKSIGIQLVVYGLTLAGLSVLAHRLAPDLARSTLILGLSGGVLCLVWGLRAIAGAVGKALSLLTLIPVNFVFLSQTVFAWSPGGPSGLTQRTAAGLITLALLLSMGMLMRIAYAGAVFDGVPAGQKNANVSVPSSSAASLPSSHAADRTR